VATSDRTMDDTESAALTTKLRQLEHSHRNGVLSDGEYEKLRQQTIAEFMAPPVAATQAVLEIEPVAWTVTGR